MTTVSILPFTACLMLVPTLVAFVRGIFDVYVACWGCLSTSVWYHTTGSRRALLLDVAVVNAAGATYCAHALFSLWRDPRYAAVLAFAAAAVAAYRRRTCHHAWVHVLSVAGMTCYALLRETI